MNHQSLPPANAGSLPPPVCVLRQWMRTGSLPAGYLTGFGAIPAEAMVLTRLEIARNGPEGIHLFVRLPATYRDRIAIGFRSSTGLESFTDLSGGTASDVSGLFSKDFVSNGIPRRFFLPWVRLRR